MLKRSRRRLECDFLEERTLLSAVHGHVVAHHAAHHGSAADVKAGHAAIPAAQPGSDPVGTAGTVTGGGLVTIGPAPSNNDTNLFQNVAIDNNAVVFLTQLELFKGTNSNLQQAATSVLTDARNLDMLANNVANSLGVTVPADLQGAMQNTVRTAALAANGGKFDQAFLTAMSTVGSTFVGQLQQLEASSTASLSTFAATALPIVQADIAAMTTVAGGGANPLTPASSTPTSTTLSSTDLNTLESSYSTTITERFLGQLASLVSNTLYVQVYGEKLITDHEQGSLQIGNYAAATGTYLPANITGSTDISSAMQVIGAGPSSSGGSTSAFDRTYLQAMITTHESDLSSDENTIGNSTNFALQRFAISDAYTDLMHLNDAIYTLKLYVPGSGTRAAVRTADRVMAHARAFLRHHA